MKSTIRFEDSMIRVMILLSFAVLLLFNNTAIGQIGDSRAIYLRMDDSRVSSIASVSQTISLEQVNALDGVISARTVQRRPTNASTKSSFQTSKFLKGIYKIIVDNNVDIHLLTEKLNGYQNVIDIEVEPAVEILFVPNDVEHSLQDYLALIHAYDAWDITQGSEDIVIAVSDNGVDVDHVDLLANKFLNASDPVNGLDDDGNGYTDDYDGVDLADDDNDPAGDIDSHGTAVTGIMSATANNEIGIAGVGFNSKYFPIKVFSSIDGVSHGNYESILYAADLGCEVINLSWGGTGTPSGILQSFIDYAVIEKDMVVVAAAGNTDADLDFYPASYDHVLSVGASDIDDNKASFATYSYKIDVMAPGASVYSTINDGGYSSGSAGSSFAAPQVAAVAALVRDVFPDMNAIQVMEQIRMTSDDIYDVGQNMDYIGKLGKGRLNAFRAVSEENLASIRSYDYSYTGQFGDDIFFRDTVAINLSFVNLLRPVSDARIAVSSPSPYVELLNSQIVLGSLDAFDSIKNVSVKIKLADNTPASESIVLRVDYSDTGGHQDFEYFEFTTAPSYLDIDNQSIRLTVTSKADLGYELASFDNGNGLSVDFQNVSNFMGIMIGNHKDSISDNVISDYNTFTREQNFVQSTNIRYFKRNDVDHYARNKFSDEIHDLVIEQEFLSWSAADSSDFLIAEYFVTNTNVEIIDSLMFGMYLDLNVDDSSINFAAWDAPNKLGYTFNSDTSQLVGLAVISNQTAIFHAIDLFDQNGDSLDIKEAFTDSIKYNYLVTEKTSAGGMSGNDVSQLLSVELDTLQGNSSKKIAYALVFGESVAELIENVNKAKAKYSAFLTRPDVEWTVSSCREEEIVLNSLMSINLYSDPLGENLIGSGSNLSLVGFNNDSSFYYKELTDLYESDLYQLYVDIANPEIEFRTDPEVLYLDDDPENRVQFIDLSLGAVDWSWDFANGSLSTLQNPKTVFNQEGMYEVELAIVTNQGCSDVSTGNFEVVQRGEAPVMLDQLICRNATATLSSSSSSSLKFYFNEDDQNAFFEGEEWTTEPLVSNQTFYVTSTAEDIESVKVPVNVTIDNVSADFTVLLDNSDLTSSQILVITDHSINANQLNWVVNGSDAGSDSLFTYDYSGLISTEVVLSVSSIIGCVGSKTVDLPFSTSPKPGIAEAIACLWDSVYAEPVNGTEFIFYSDNTLQEIIAKGNNAVLGPIVSDTSFYITNITDYLESEAVAFDVKLVAHNPVIISDPDSLSIDASPNVTFWVDSEEISSYKWYVDEAFVEATARPTLTFDSLGEYSVTLVSQHTLGCVDTTSISYQVYKVLGLSESLENSLRIYPNPTRDEINIQLNGKAQFISEIRVHDMSGKLFHPPTSIHSKGATISIESLPKGLYLISGVLEGEVFTLKVRKE